MMFCDQGQHAALADVPSDPSFCAVQSEGRWQNRLFLGAASFTRNEDSGVLGLGELVLNLTRDAVYRTRNLGDSVAPSAVGSLGTPAPRSSPNACANRRLARDALLIQGRRE